MVEYFNFFYGLYIALALFLLTVLYLLLRGKSKKTSAIILFGLLFSSFVLHFLKLTAGYYQSWMPYSIRTVTPENVCAVSVLIFPWFFLSKKKILKDYMFYMGMISGIGTTIIPVDVIGHHAFEFETVRFYFSHILLWVVPLLMVLLKLHTLDYKRIVKVPLLVYLVLGIILVNEVILAGAGFVRIDYFYSYELRNSSLIFGPQAAVEFLGGLFLPLTPQIFTTVPVGANAGDVYYWPIVWLIIPSFIYFSIVSLLLSLPFEYKSIRKDILAFISRRQNK
jgi:hypothetical protein